MSRLRHILHQGIPMAGASITQADETLGISLSAAYAFAFLILLVPFRRNEIRP
jgi:hypothetical protein